VRRAAMSAGEKQQVWELWRSGKSLRAVARAVGCGEQQLRRYVWSTGGVRPAPRRRAARCLSVAEREEISRALSRGDSCRQIGAALGRSHSTVSREVKLNGGRDRYRALNADRDAWQRARRPKLSKLATSPMLRAVVEQKLELRWSPQQIAAWLSRTYSECEAMRISHETIYLSLFVQSRGALRRELTAQLRRGHTTRRPHGCPLPQGRGQIKNKLMISERPAEAEDRAVPGHWEGDLLLGKLPSAIVTLVERSSRFTQLIALPNGRKGEHVRLALVASIATLPEQLRRSLTWDQGHEMAQHAQFSIDSGVQVYFCDPRSPWQRGSSENTNGLLRQYFPRNTDIAVTQAHLDEVAAELNGRPRKTLGWMTPAEKLAELTAAI
jgi:IS30 family transposase